MFDRIIICYAATTMGLMRAVSAPGQDSLRTKPMEKYVEANMNGYKISVDHGTFFKLMPDVIEYYPRLDSLERLDLQRRLTLMGDATKNDGIVHLSLEGKWRSLFEQLLAECLSDVYIVDERTGQVVPYLWMRGQSSSHGVSWGKYYADKGQSKKVFSFRRKRWRA